MQILTVGLAWGPRSYISRYLGDSTSSGTHILSSDHVPPEEGGVGLPGGTPAFERGQPKKTLREIGNI